MTNKFTTEELCEVGETLIRKCVKLLNLGFKELADKYLQHLQSAVTGKSSLLADQDAEKVFALALKTIRGKRFENIRFFGEEDFRRGAIDLTDEKRTCVLVDALDGSDLFERDMGNWCSAATFFTPSEPPGRRIRAAIIGLPDETVFIADDERPGVLVKTGPQTSRQLRGRSQVQELADASICFYGQKVKNFIVTATNPGWPSLLREKGQRGAEKLTPRVYNLAGIPMIVKLIDKPSEDGSSIDIVMDLIGQQPHDVIPGAFLAKKAGASVLHTDGTEISIEHLEEVILKPNVNKLKYVVASTRPLADAAVACFCTEGATQREMDKRASNLLL